jgi:hypothetical protein
VTALLADAVFVAAVIAWTAALPVLAAGREHRPPTRREER